MAWTSEQKQAIGISGSNLLVAAAAGSGKTSVLIERIIQRILPEDGSAGIDIDRLLIVTFTRAAAAEMRERLFLAIQERADRCTSRAQTDRLYEQQALLGKSYITTIDSFCQSVVRGNFNESGIDSSYRVADEGELRLLREDALEEVLERWYAKEDPAFYRLVETYGTYRSDQGLAEQILSIHAFIQSDPEPEAWLKTQRDCFLRGPGADFGQTVWGREILRMTAVKLQGAYEASERLRLAAEHAGLGGYAQTLAADQLLLRKLADSCACLSWREAWNAFSDLQFSTLKRLTKAESEAADETVREQIKNGRNRIKDDIREMNAALFGSGPDMPLREMDLLYPDIVCLVNVVLDFCTCFAELKRSRRILDFSDMEHIALRVLTAEGCAASESPSPSEAALRYREQFEEVYIDEYQDTNLIQERILALVSKGRNLFMVGDVKQSIYGFRQARPDLFLEKYGRYEIRDGLFSPDSPDRLVRLFTNFRSRRNIVNGVNYIFSRIMNEITCGMAYTQEEYLNYGADYYDSVQAEMSAAPKADAKAEPKAETESEMKAGPKAEAEFEMRTAPKAEAETAPSAGLDYANELLVIPSDLSGKAGREMEAAAVAERVRALISSGFSVYDKRMKQMRPIMYKDIVILLRVCAGSADQYGQRLLAAGIPAFYEEKGGFFGSVEINLILCYLKIVDNPLQDIPLLAVMHSPIFCFTDSELAEVKIYGKQQAAEIAPLLPPDRTADGAGSGTLAADASGRKDEIPFYTLCLRRAERVSDALSDKLRRFLDHLQALRAFADTQQVSELVWNMIHENGYYDYVGRQLFGEERQANLILLFHKAAAFDRGANRGIFRFLYFFNKLRKKNGDLSSASLINEGMDVVRIMSIHKSKGLEFPVVFLCEAGQPFNSPDTKKRLVQHRSLGFGPTCYDDVLRCVYPSVMKRCIISRMADDMKSEEMRLLYVAMTRAREKLIISGKINSDYNSFREECRGKCAAVTGLPVDYHVLNAKSYMEWLGMALSSLSFLPSGCADGTESAGEPQKQQIWHIFVKESRQIQSAEHPLESSVAAPTESSAVVPTESSAAAPAAFSAESSALQLGSKRSSDSPPWIPVGKDIQRLDQQTTHEILRPVPAKISVSEIKRLREEAEGERVYAHKVPMHGLPDFLYTKASDITPAEKGTLLHACLQVLDYSQCLRVIGEASQSACLTAAAVADAFGRSDISVAAYTAAMSEIIEQLIERMVAEAYISELEGQAVERTVLLQYLQTPLARRMMHASAAGTLFREIPFTIMKQWKDIILYEERITKAGGTVPSDDPFQAFSNEERQRRLYSAVAVQGMIDCYFTDGNEDLVLVDFKSDHILPGREQQAAEKYRVQMECYSEALLRITGIAPKERLICFLRAGKVCSL